MNALAITRSRGGDWYGRYGLVPGPGHSDRDRSLKLWDGPDGIKVYSFAGDDWRACRAFLGLEDGRRLSAQDLEKARQRREAAQRKAAADAARKRARAKQLWAQSLPAPGSLVDLYLCSRGIENIPQDIRFHPACPHGPTGTIMPAMLALVRDAERRVLAVHRTFLTLDGRKIDGEDAKLALGPIEDGAVHLRWPQRDTLGLAEGIESAASCWWMFSVPTWASLGSRYACSIPPHVRKVIIFADRGKAGEAAARAGRDLYRAQGRTVEVRLPWGGDGWQGDWNDLLQEHRR